LRYILGKERWQLQACFLNLIALVFSQFAWIIYKFLATGSIFVERTTHFGLLQFSLSNFNFYLNTWSVLFFPIIAWTPLLVFAVRKKNTSTLDSHALSYLLFLTATFLASVFFYQWQEARFTIFFLPLVMIVSLAVLDRNLSQGIPLAAYFGALLLGCIFSAAPTIDLMRPKFRAYLSKMVEIETWKSNNFVSVALDARSEDLAKNNPCFSFEQSSNRFSIAPECNNYINRNLLHYLNYKAHVQFYTRTYLREAS
ncbi:MAG: hypothetical protein KDD42_08910, partial [Bdellovibrionales bacterium]|nr:hypothetical protein [Bdellovibrionales bacterium]